MATQSKSGASATRLGRRSSSAPATTGRGRFARGTATPRRRTPTTGLRRRKPQQSTVQKAMGAILPTAAAKKAAPSSKKGKAGGIALAAAAAGMAFKNRGKLTQVFHKDDPAGAAGAHDANANSTVPPATVGR